MHLTTTTRVTTARLFIRLDIIAERTTVAMRIRAGVMRVIDPTGVMTTRSSPIMAHDRRVSRLTTDGTHGRSSPEIKAIKAGPRAVPFKNEASFCDRRNSWGRQHDDLPDTRNAGIGAKLALLVARLRPSVNRRSLRADEVAL